MGAAHQSQNITEKVAALLRESGAAYAEFDDSSTDGNCWVVETKDAWYEGLAEEIVNLVKASALRAAADQVEDVTASADLRRWADDLALTNTRPSPSDGAA